MGFATGAAATGNRLVLVSRSSLESGSSFPPGRRYRSCRRRQAVWRAVTNTRSRKGTG